MIIIIDYYNVLLYNICYKDTAFEVSNITTEVNKMKKYVCDVCGYEYDPTVGDPDNGIAPGTAFEDLPEDWTCPLCGVEKDNFSAAE